MELDKDPWFEFNAISHSDRKPTTMTDSRFHPPGSVVLDLRLLGIFVLTVCVLPIIGCDSSPDRSEGNDSRGSASREKLVRDIGLPTVAAESDVKPPVVPEASVTTKTQTGKSDPSETSATNPSGDVSNPQTDTALASESQQQSNLRGAWIDTGSLPILQWEIIYLGNRPVGYTRRSIEIATPKRVEQFGTLKDTKSVTLVCLEAESRIRISRKSSDPIDQTVFLRTLEKLDGELLGIEGNIDTGIVKRKFTGSVHDGALSIQTTEDRVVSSNSVPWDPSYRGPFAIEQSLRKSPMQLKEVRVVRYLDPFQMAVTESSLEGLSEGQTVDFEGQFADRLEIENRSTTQGRTSSSLLWTDRSGIVRKSYTAGLDRLSFDCDPVTARYVISKEEFDASTFKDLPLLGSFAKIPDAEQGGFRIASEFLRPDGSISSKTNQTVERVNEKTWDVQVRSVSEDGVQDTADLPGLDALASTGVIDWKEPTIQRWLSSQIATPDSSANTGSDTQSQQRQLLAAKTRTWISKNVGRTELDRTLQTATSTLRSRKGDAMDQAILLTGALRGLSIPARVAIGFRAEPSTIRPTYHLHLWVEYHDSIRWIPIDSFLETDTVPIDRIKITESTMPSLNAYEPILTAIRLTADMELTARTRKP
jgi:hypothetical protein